mmetsp:Transcript_67790/g.196027  ORF Transcript_67790/g.196027 Transcript_67790/m.196027 type:complete len:339 (-) Transcript_67790:232-1248(-)
MDGASCHRPSAGGAARRAGSDVPEHAPDDAAAAAESLRAGALGLLGAARVGSAAAHAAAASEPRQWAAPAARAVARRGAGDAISGVGGLCRRRRGPRAVANCDTLAVVVFRGFAADGSGRLGVAMLGISGRGAGAGADVCEQARVLPAGGRDSLDGARLPIAASAPLRGAGGRSAGGILATAIVGGASAAKRGEPGGQSGRGQQRRGDTGVASSTGAGRIGPWPRPRRRRQGGSLLRRGRRPLLRDEVSLVGHPPLEIGAGASGEADRRPEQVLGDGFPQRAARGPSISIVAKGNLRGGGRCWQRRREGPEEAPWRAEVGAPLLLCTRRPTALSCRVR